MKAITKKSAFIVLGVAIFASGYFGLKVIPIAQVDSSSSTLQEQMSVPAPVQGQKKVVLKDLGMT